MGLTFNTGLLSDAIKVDSTLKVGIGTSTPVSLLHLQSGNLTIAKTAIGSGTEVGNITFRNDYMGAYEWAAIKTFNGASHDYSNIAFYTTNGFNSSTEKMRISSSGNVGIGTSSPEALLHLNKAVAGGEGAFIFIDNSAGSTLGNKAGIRFATNAGASFNGYGSFIEAVNTNAGNGAESMIFGTWNGGSRGERMRITSGGDVIMRYNAYVGNTASDAPAIITFQNVINGYYFGFQSIGTDRFTFVNGAPTEVGYLTGGGVFYSSGGGTSDRRMKQNIEYITTNCIDAIQELKPAKFEFIDNPEKTRRGFIAQDVLEVIPDLVLGNGDEEKGIYGLDYDGILAIAVKAIQEQQEIINKLSAKVTALENK